MLDSVGFHGTHRTGKDWILWMNSATQERAHQLLQAHGNRYVTDSDLERYAKNCPTCQSIKSE